MVHLRAFGRPFWTVTTFLLNTILFLMVGVSLPGIISSMPQATLTRALILIPAIYVAMVLARFVGHHSIIFAIRALDRRPQQRERRTNFRSRLVTTVAGFRGAISLAMAVSIPLAFGDSVYEERDIIILVVAGVTLLSLIIQGIALPVVVRWAAQAPTPFLEMNARAEAGETQVVGATVRDLIEEIDSLASSVDVTDADTIERVRADYLQRMHNLMMSGDFKEYSFRENDLEAEKDLRYRILEELIHESEEKKYNLSWLRECVYELKLNKSVHTKLEKMVTAFYEEWKRGSERNLLSELIFKILNCGDLLRMFESELPEGITEMARLSKAVIAKSRIWAEKVYKGLDQYAKFLDSSVKDQVFKNIILYQIELGKHAEQYKVALYCIQNRKELEKKEGKEEESLL